MENFFYNLETFLKREISRKKFLKVLLGGFAFFIFQNTFLKAAFAKQEPSEGRTKKHLKGDYDLVLTEGNDPYQNAIKAMEAMGGMERFIDKGDVVVIKHIFVKDKIVGFYKVDFN